MSVELRVLRTADELAVMPEFEAKIWGGQDDRVSVNMLVACIEEGGVAIGAFDGDRMVGSLFGFRTFEARVLHSHYMAVDAEYRRGGLGEQLKRRQAEWCVDNGVTAMRWTFDPLQLTNAHLNLNKLGALGVTYHVNHYGALGGSSSARARPSPRRSCSMCRPCRRSRSRHQRRKHCTRGSPCATRWRRTWPTVGR